jgi:hypothetical protein
MPLSDLPTGRAYPIRTARSAGTGLQAIGLSGQHCPRWALAADVPSATIISTDFYYGFGQAILHRDHPLHDTQLADFFAESREDLVDMEVASFYALATRFMPPDVQFLAIKAAANPAGDGALHLANTPTSMDSCLQLAMRLLS